VTALIAGRAFLRQMKLARLKTDLVAAVSHELKTPLAAMSLLVDSLLESPENDPQRVREYLELISRENARLSRLISNFLTFSRMERNRSQFEFAPTNAHAVARAAIDSIGDRYHVEVSVIGDLPPLYADEDALVTVLLNLLDNAFKYSREPRRIELSAYLEEGRCCFAIRDNGIGIAPREQKRIFRRLCQVDRHLTSHTGGVGLGLSIVEFIVEAHGGEVRVESRPGSGSRFVVTLPAMATVKGAAA
jgi:signal transduction histidine kinase